MFICSIVLVLCICLFTFQPMSRYSQMSIYTHGHSIRYPPFFSSFRKFVNRCCLVYQQPNTNVRFFFRLHFVVLGVFFVSLTFSHSNCFMLAHCLSVVQILIFSRLFFLSYLYFMHTKVEQRSI